MNLTPTTLLQSLIVHHFESGGQTSFDTAPLAALGGKLAALTKACERLEQASDRAVRPRLLFEVIKSRAALFHSLDQALGDDRRKSMKVPIEARRGDAHQYPRCVWAEFQEPAQWDPANFSWAVRWQTGRASFALWTQMAVRATVVQNICFSPHSSLFTADASTEPAITLAARALYQRTSISGSGF